MLNWSREALDVKRKRYRLGALVFSRMKLTSRTTSTRYTKTNQTDETNQMDQIVLGKLICF